MCGESWKFTTSHIPSKLRSQSSSSIQWLKIFSVILKSDEFQTQRRLTMQWPRSIIQIPTDCYDFFIFSSPNKYSFVTRSPNLPYWWFVFRPLVQSTVTSNAVQTYKFFVCECCYLINEFGFKVTRNSPRGFLDSNCGQELFSTLR